MFVAFNMEAKNVQPYFPDLSIQTINHIVDGALDDQYTGFADMPFVLLKSKTHKYNIEVFKRLISVTEAFCDGSDLANLALKNTSNYYKRNPVHSGTLLNMSSMVTPKVLKYALECCRWVVENGSSE